MPDDLVERPDPTSVALVLRQCVITFGGVEQTKLGERAHDVITQLEAENARLRKIIEDADNAFADAVQTDCENGVKWLNERAAERYLVDAPATKKAILQFQEAAALARQDG